MLVVDDEPTIVVTLQDDLQELGFEVVAARLLVAGAEACRSKPFANGGVVAWLAARRSA